MDLHRCRQTGGSSCNAPTPAATPRYLNLAQVGGHCSGQASQPLGYDEISLVDVSKYVQQRQASCFPLSDQCKYIKPMFYPACQSKSVERVQANMANRTNVASMNQELYLYAQLSDPNGIRIQAGSENFQRAGVKRQRNLFVARSAIFFSVPLRCVHPPPREAQKSCFMYHDLFYTDRIEGNPPPSPV